jgi:ribosomal protein S18 acetylase RimI-like enzyme
MDDFPAVLTLLHQLWPDQPLAEDALHAVFGKALDSESRVCLCAVVGERVIGFGSLTIKNSLWQTGPLAHVDELVVDSACRGGGVGTRLLKELVGLAQRRGCRRIEMDSALHRDAAHRFYKRHGFENRACVFSKRLEKPP